MASRNRGATAAGRLRDPNGLGLAAGPREGAAWYGGTVGIIPRGPSAENRHGGAPTGAVPVAWDGPCLANTVVALRRRDRTKSAPLGAPPTPRGEGAGKEKTGGARETPQEKEDERRMRRREKENRSGARKRVAETGKGMVRNDVRRRTRQASIQRVDQPNTRNGRRAN